MRRNVFEEQEFPLGRFFTLMLLSHFVVLGVLVK